jgi:alpha-ketoglutarate-dependent taurine dioxygenase
MTFNMRLAEDRQLPVVIEPGTGRGRSLAGLVSMAEERRGYLHSELLWNGALLFRNFDLPDADSFRGFVRTFSQKEFFGYEGGVSPRTGLGSGVYTSTEYPPDMVLTLHNEMSYSVPYPDQLYFFCVTPAEHGGETTLGDSRRILRRMDREIAEEFRSRGVRYERNLGPHKGSGYSWQDAFETDDDRTVEDICRKKGMDFEWTGNGYLRVSQTRPATAQHPVTGEEVWFNQAEGFHPSVMDRQTYEWFIDNNEPFRLNARFGDGTEIPLEMLESIRAVVSEETVPHRWMKGDIIVVDNILSAHGRLPFSGERKIVLAMT